ncbi:ABC transporter permease [Ideonella sp. DXS22W]|uniref:ABC transporter permease n=1 Tax=Pseudaquabacterium inlustre TaxID=2984192 RepID=A0ABU9CK41_9BURK
MAPPAALPRFQPLHAARRWLATWWQIVHLGALVGALLLTPSTYAPARRPLLARHLVGAALPLLGWFGVVSTLLSLVIARIVLVTAASYGLSQYALGMVVRVLVLELIPLAAALFVAVRVSVPAAAQLAALREGGALEALRRRGGSVLHDEVLPRAAAALFCMVLLAAFSSLVSLLLAYLLAHGFTPWGLARFTRQVGQVFTPAVSLIFLLKTLGFGAAVAVIPLGSGLHDRAGRSSPLPLELQGLVRLFAAILLIEVLSLMGNYA